MKKDEGYKVIAHKFIGYHDYGNGEGSYTYELTFNKSMVHTGKHDGIEKGLNDYDKTETKKAFYNSFKNVWYSFIRVAKLMLS